MGELILIPSFLWFDRGARPDPVDDDLNVAVPERGPARAARRAWFSDRWRAFHLHDPTAELPITTRLHWQLRRRRG